MRKVQWMPWWWVAGGLAVLGAVGANTPLSAAGTAAGVAYLAVSTLLLSRALRRAGAVRLGPANAVTATRSALVGVATAMTVTAFAEGAASPLLFATIVGCALVLDGVDGYVARRTRSESDIGARFDMEVDAFLLLVLSVHVGPFVGWWVLTIGLLRYAFVAAGWVLPWMNRTLPPRYWRKVVTAAAGIALTLISARMLPPVADLALAVAALLLLVESFGRDVIWLALNRERPQLVSPEKASTISRKSG